MTRLGISVEGATEREFVTRVIAPSLAPLGVYATPIDMRGKVSLDRVERELRALLYKFDRVSTLYDYYGFQSRPAGNVDTLERSIIERVPEDRRHRVVPYVQSYEFEALVLAAPESAEQVLGCTGIAEQFRTIVADCGGAEQVNDSYDTCPSRRIRVLAPGYDKKLHGPVILAPALRTVRSQCPRFDRWLRQLEELA